MDRDVSAEQLAQALEGDELITLKVGPAQLDNDDLSPLPMLVKLAEQQQRLDRLVGRIVVLFDQGAGNPPEAAERQACRDWFAALDREVPELPFLLHPEAGFPLYLSCRIGFRKVQGKLVLDREEAQQAVIECATRFACFAEQLGKDPKAAGERFIRLVIGAMGKPK